MVTLLFCFLELLRIDLPEIVTNTIKSLIEILTLHTA